MKCAWTPIDLELITGMPGHQFMNIFRNRSSLSSYFRCLRSDCLWVSKITKKIKTKCLQNTSFFMFFRNFDISPRLPPSPSAVSSSSSDSSQSLMRHLDPIRFEDFCSKEESSGQEREVVSNSRKRSGAGGVGGTSLKYNRLISVDLTYLCIYSNPQKLFNQPGVTV